MYLAFRVQSLDISVAGCQHVGTKWQAKQPFILIFLKRLKLSV